jgi:hypothetical protein
MNAWLPHMGAAQLVEEVVGRDEHHEAAIGLPGGPLVPTRRDLGPRERDGAPGCHMHAESSGPGSTTRLPLSAATSASIVSLTYSWCRA